MCEISDRISLLIVMLLVLLILFFYPGVQVTFPDTPGVSYPEGWDSACLRHPIDRAVIDLQVLGYFFNGEYLLM